jgi:Ca2+-binding RTX toxin-like protein
VTGSKYDDVIKGDNQANILSGGKGNDELHGREGNDTLNGGDGKDTLYTGSGRNTVDGGNGDDEVVLQLEHQQSSAYHDHLLGGEGTDTLSFSVGASFSSFAGVVVFIDREGMPPDPIFGETQTTGLVRSHGANGSITSNRVEAEIDGFENADGTDQDDMLYGSFAAGNRINGFGGNDEISGFAGADFLFGGSGRDKFFASDDNVTDEIDGGDGSDTVSYEDTLYESMSHGVLVTLGNNGAAGTTQVVFSTGAVSARTWSLSSRTGFSASRTSSDPTSTTPSRATTPTTDSRAAGARTSSKAVAAPIFSMAGATPIPSPEEPKPIRSVLPISATSGRGRTPSPISHPVPTRSIWRRSGRRPEPPTISTRSTRQTCRRRTSSDPATFPATGMKFASSTWTRIHGGSRSTLRPR